MKKDNLDKIVESMIEENNITTMSDVNNLFSTLQGKIVQSLLNGEMNVHLGYEKSSSSEKTNGNRRNGYSSKDKKIRTDKGEITVSMPRDRRGTFEPTIVGKRQRVMDSFEEITISMYSKGMSLTDIGELIKKIYKVELSIEFLSNLTKSVNEEVKIWQQRQLKSCYAFVYVDCLFTYVKQELKSAKKAVYVMLGINLSGQKEVIGIWTALEEGASFWANILEEIKERGVKDILFISMDGLKGLKEAIELVYPKTITQRCIVHIVRNIYNILPKKGAGEIIKDFKKIYTANNEEAAKIEYEFFITKYHDNKQLIKKVEENINHILGLFNYPKEIRKIIYTTNAIESLNSALRKVTNGKGSFINEEALIKVMYLRIKDLEIKWKGKMPGWNIIISQLIILFDERITKHLDL